MNMTRRGFLATSAGLLLSTLVKAAPRPLDLSTFCYPFDGKKYDMRTPFRQGDWLYATNAKVAVRATPNLMDADLGIAKLPPADGLPWWDHDSRRGWKPLRGETLLAIGDCPTCDGWGLVGNLRDCPECHGENPLCCPCERGIVGDRKCPDCPDRNNGWTAYPCLVRVGNSYFSAHEFRKFPDGCEFAGEAVWATKVGDAQPLRIRGDGFCGLLMPLNREYAEANIVK